MMKASIRKSEKSFRRTRIKRKKEGEKKARTRESKKNKRAKRR